MISISIVMSFIETAFHVDSICVMLIDTERFDFYHKKFKDISLLINLISQQQITSFVGVFILLVNT